METRSQEFGQTFCLAFSFELCHEQLSFFIALLKAMQYYFASRFSGAGKLK